MKVDDALDRAITDGIEQRKVPGVSVAFVEDAEVAGTPCWGTATAATIFEAASMGKALTGYVTMRLVEGGRFDLARPLSEYLGDRHVDDPRIDAITARHALTHQTGLWRDDWESLPYFEHDPGERFKYSNEGFYFMQLAIERATGEGLESLATQLAFEPLEMTSSSYLWRDDYEQRKAIPHDHEGNALERWEPDRAKAPTSLHTTASDYARLIAAVLGPRADTLSEEGVAEMLRPQVEVHEVWGAGGPAPGSYWGLGWGIQTQPRSFWHWGWNDGFLSFAVGWPETKRGVVAFTNGMNGLWLCKDVVTWFDGEPHPAFRWLEH